MAQRCLCTLAHRLALAGHPRCLKYRETFGAYLGQDLFYLTAFAEAYIASLDKAAQVQHSHAHLSNGSATSELRDCNLLHGRDSALRCCPCTVRHT